MLRLFATVEQMDYLNLTVRSNSMCHIYKPLETFKFNYFVWTLGFFLGLQFTHLDQGILQNLTLDWNVMKNWPWYMWVIFCGLILLILAIFTYLSYLYYSIGILKIYFGMVVLLILVLSFITMKMKAQKRHLHIHHYFIGLVMVALTCYQSVMATLI